MMGHLFDVKSRIIYSITSITTTCPAVLLAVDGPSLMMYVEWEPVKWIIMCWAVVME